LKTAEVRLVRNFRILLGRAQHRRATSNFFLAANNS